MLRLFIMSLALLMTISFSQEATPESQTSPNPFTRLIQFIDQISSSEEHLLHQERMGPYLVNADGQRLVEHPYLRFSISQDGKAIPSSSIVTLDSILYVNNQDALERSYTAIANGNTFLIDPLDLSTLSTPGNSHGGWFRFTLTIDSGDIKETKEFALDYFPPRPDAGLTFRLISTLIPILLLGGIIILFVTLKINRNQETTEPLLTSSSLT